MNNFPWALSIQLHGYLPLLSLTTLWSAKHKIQKKPDWKTGELAIFAQWESNIDDQYAILNLHMKKNNNSLKEKSN